MKLIIASNNAHKVKEIKRIVEPFFPEICTMKEAGLSLEVEENGTTFQENAVKKAEETLLAATGFDAALADDSGLIVDALNGAPGVYSARYAGTGHNDAQNNAKLLENMENVPEEQRTCRFACAIALARRGKPTLCVLGTCEGRLLRAPRGENGFGYDPLFFYEPAGCSFAELPGEEKDRVSHRSNALHKMEALLQQER